MGGLKMVETGLALILDLDLGTKKALKKAREKQKELSCAFTTPTTLLMKMKKVKLVKKKLQDRRSQNQIIIRGLDGLGGEERLENRLTKTENFVCKRRTEKWL